MPCLNLTYTSTSYAPTPSAGKHCLTCSPGGGGAPAHFLPCPFNIACNDPSGRKRAYVHWYLHNTRTHSMYKPALDAPIPPLWITASSVLNPAYPPHSMMSFHLHYTFRNHRKNYRDQSADPYTITIWDWANGTEIESVPGSQNFVMCCCLCQRVYTPKRMMCKHIVNFIVFYCALITTVPGHTASHSTTTIKTQTMTLQTTNGWCLNLDQPHQRGHEQP